MSPIQVLLKSPLRPRLCFHWVVLALLLFILNAHCSPTSKQLEVRWTRPWQNETGSSLLGNQMKNPSEVYSVLLIIGGDIVQKAIAQMAGRRITPVAFSFGWVAYSFNALMSAFGDGSLMPQPDYPASVILISSRIKKSNNSWIIGRLIRDLEREVTDTLKSWSEIAPHGPMEIWEGDSALLITFFKASPGAGKPTSHLDRIGFMVCLVIQLTVATIPTFLYGNWSILFITAVGTILSVSTASLKEWRREKYKCRKNSKHDYAVTRGNGHSHVFVIQSGSASPGGAGPGLFLDDLAGAVQKSDRRTKTLSVCFAFLWICFMITAAAIKDNTWFLLIVGLVGMTQNIWVAGRPRESAAHGIPVERIGHTYGRREKNKARPRVTNVLKEVELAYPGVGRAIRSEFLPDHALRPQEIQWWDNPPYPPANPPPNPPNPPPNPHPSQAVNQLVANQSPQNQPPINPPLVNPPPVTHSPATNQSTNQQPAN